MVSLLVIPLLLPLSLAQCSSECSPVSTLLSTCALPPISEARDAVRGDTRNLTRLEYKWPSLSGPYTSLIKTLSDAECLYTDGRKDLPTCERCLSIDRFENQDHTSSNKEFSLNMYRADYEAFGYYENDTLAFPSTTRTDMPSSIGSLEIFDNTCAGICSVIRAQTEDCDLTSLDQDDPPRQINVDLNYQANVLHNRTASGCMCSLPVLRRFRGCRRCIDDERDAGMLDILNFYEEECNEFGYWSDSAVVLPVDEEEVVDEDEENVPTDAAGKALYISTGAVGAVIGLLLVLFGSML
ncbi:hypothetical protein BJX99DRAFT_264421 [Aspergillus californicus]